jgi:uncharacterized protein with PQ loop repeat
MTFIGWVGSILFSVCGLPQSIKTWKDGNADGLDMNFLLLWTGGEIFTLIAVLDQAPKIYLIFNYFSNLIFLLVIWRFKLYPRKALIK